MTLPVWFDSGFILSLTAMIGGGCGYLLVFCLKSRCRTVECCCIKCERDVIPPNQLSQIEVV